MGRIHNISHFGGFDTHLRVPLVELAGHNRVLIENHIGVLSYFPEEITVKVSGGCVRISGEGMMLAEMSREQLVIMGQINAVYLYRR